MFVVLEIEIEVYGCLGYQVWRLTTEGKLLHKGSGFCAVPLSSEGTRTWVARGSSGLTHLLNMQFNLCNLT